jgi:hypothetical protein
MTKTSRDPNAIEQTRLGGLRRTCLLKSERMTTLTAAGNDRV